MKFKHNYKHVGLNCGRHSEHFTALVAKQYIPPDIWHSYKKIGFVRHPYKWVESLYNLKETRDAFKQDNSLPFSQFVNNFNISMYHWFTDKNGMMLIDEVYRLEDLEEVLASYGVRQMELNITKKGPLTWKETDKKIIDFKFKREFENHYMGENKMVIIRRQNIVEGIEFEPEERGLTNQEVKQLRKPSRPEPETKFVRIVTHGVGEITVAKEDGHKYRRYGGTLAWRNNNPGNLKYGNFAKSTQSIGSGQGKHAVYASYEDGRRAMWKLLFTNARDYYTRTIIRAISKYAPTSDGNYPKIYANYIAAHIEMPVTTKLNELNDKQQMKMLDAMIRFEGFKIGQEAVVT